MPRVMTRPPRCSSPQQQQQQPQQHVLAAARETHHPLFLTEIDENVLRPHFSTFYSSSSLLLPLPTSESHGYGRFPYFTSTSGKELKKPYATVNDCSGARTAWVGGSRPTSNTHKEGVTHRDPQPHVASSNTRANTREEGDVCREDAMVSSVCPAQQYDGAALQPTYKAADGDIRCFCCSLPFQEMRCAKTFLFKQEDVATCHTTPAAAPYVLFSEASSGVHSGENREEEEESATLEMAAAPFTLLLCTSSSTKDKPESSRRSSQDDAVHGEAKCAPPLLSRGVGVHSNDSSTTDVCALSLWYHAGCTQLARLLLPVRRNLVLSDSHFRVLHKTSSCTGEVDRRLFGWPHNTCADVQDTKVNRTTTPLAANIEDVEDGDVDPVRSALLFSPCASSERPASTPLMCTSLPSSASRITLPRLPSPLSPALVSLWRSPHWQRMRSYARFERAVQDRRRWRSVSFSPFMGKDEEEGSWSSCGVTQRSPSLPVLSPRRDFWSPVQPPDHSRHLYRCRGGQHCEGCANMEVDKEEGSKYDYIDEVVNAAALWAAYQICLQDDIRKTQDAA